MIQPSILAAESGALTIAFQPLIHVQSGLAFAYQAITPTGSCRPIEDAIRGAASFGILDTEALLVVPLRAGAGTPEAILAHLFRAALAHRLPLDCIVAEIAIDERADLVPAARLIDACTDRGIAVALDRFAAGPVALQLLARFTPRYVKLDSGLTRGIDTSASRRLIVEAALRLTRSLGTTVVAQEIGTRAELTTLYGMGIGHMQGDWIAAPSLQRLPRPKLPRRREPRSGFAAAQRDLSPAHRRLAHHLRSAERSTSHPLPTAAHAQAG